VHDAFVEEIRMGSLIMAHITTCVVGCKLRIAKARKLCGTGRDFQFLPIPGTVTRSDVSKPRPRPQTQGQGRLCENILWVITTDNPVFQCSVILLFSMQHHYNDDDGRLVVGKWNVRIQCTFTINCIILWPMALWFMPRPQTQGHAKKFGLKAKTKN